MDGVHDLGGVQGFGKLEREKNEPVFHSAWERRVFGMMMSGMARGLCNLDQARHAIERMDPARYLATSYYEHWLAGIERVLLEKGIVQPGEIDARVAKAPASQAEVPRAEDPQFAAALVQGVGVGFPATRDGIRPAPRASSRATACASAA
jgi:nitrile hydratase subunit beta